MDPFEPLDQMLRGPGSVGPAERLRRMATPARLAGAAVVAAVVGALVVIASASPPPVEMSMPRASASAPDAWPRSSGGSTDERPVGDRGAGSPTSTHSPDVVVHVAGAVATPGLVSVPFTARLADALAAAGGPTGGADVDRLNLAAPVVDGSRVYVPVVGQAEPAVVSGSGPAAVDGGAPGAGLASEPVAGPVDLNTATAEQLDVLPGVGPATAAAIVAHRNENGPFLGVDELQDVRGIGPAKFDALRDLVLAGR